MVKQPLMFYGFRCDKLSVAASGTLGHDHTIKRSSLRSDPPQSNLYHSFSVLRLAALLHKLLHFAQLLHLPSHVVQLLNQFIDLLDR